MKRVYLDNAATTPLSEEVIKEMVSSMKNFGNPSSTHSFGQETKILIENVRRNIADFLKVSPSEIIFTSCGTESNNMIIKSCVRNLGVERIITSPIEHKCVSETVMEMKTRKNVEVVYLRPNNHTGDFDLQQLEELLKNSEKKTLVSLMHANNEIGNLLDIEKVAQICKENNALFHSDTVQTIAHLDLDFSKIPVDFASCSAHKFHGPKGAGFAFVRKSSGLKALITGGPQERSLRAGTENVTGIVGLGKALEISMQNLENYSKQISEIKEYTIEKLRTQIPEIEFNGRSAEKEGSLYTVLSVLLPFKDPLIGMKLDMKGIAISQGSACSSGASKPSMVMLMLLDDEKIKNTTPLRISFSHLTTKEDIDYLVEVLEHIAAEHKIENVK